MTMDMNVWAKGALRREAAKGEYSGLSYEQASRRASAICAAAAETGQTMKAETHLRELHAVMWSIARAYCNAA